MDDLHLSPPRTSGSDYDLLPYRSVCYAQSRPAHLAAMAKLFGLEPPPIETARVLELGCASGGNLIPLAAQFPEARFLGIDLSARQVADGQRLIDELGLTNIELRQGDIAALDLAGATFDYMVCHGVYSWIPPEAQDAVFRVTAQTLSEDGVAYVSYNTYPGWHMRTIVRDICLYHAGTEGAPAYRVARARWVLEKLASETKETTPYGQLLRNEAKLNASQPDSYILGEFLATHNAPCFFHEFLARAGKHDLHYLSESDLAASIPENMGAETAKLVRGIAGSDGLAVEQYMDFFVGRPFRRTLLAKAGAVRKAVRQVNAGRLAQLHVAANLQRMAEPNAQGATVFKSPRGEIAAGDELSTALLDELARCWPETRTPGELCGALLALEADRQKLAASVLTTLFRLLASGLLDVASAPLRCGRADAVRPVVWPLARSEAGSGQSWMSSRWHSPVGIDKGQGTLIAAMDGTRDRAQLADLAVDLILSGRLVLPGLEMSGHSGRAQLRQVAERMVAQALRNFERAALLLPEGYARRPTRQA